MVIHVFKANILVVISLILVGLFIPMVGVSGESPVKVYVSDNFNTLNETTWNALNYSYYGIMNGTLYSKYMPYGRYLSWNNALRHIEDSKISKVVVHFKILVLSNTSRQRSDWYRFNMMIHFRDYGIGFSLSGYGRLYVTYYGNDYNRGSGIATYYLPLKDSPYYINIYLIQTKYYLEYNIYYPNGNVITNTLKKSTDNIGYITAMINWWWLSTRSPTTYKPTVNIIPEEYNTEYTYGLDKVSIVGIPVQGNTTTNTAVKNNEIKDFIDTYGMTIALLLAVSGILLSGIVGKYNEFPFIFGISILVLWIIASFTPYLHINVIWQILLALGTSFLITSAIYSYKGENNIFTSWGYAVSLFFFGLFIILGVI